MNLRYKLAQRVVLAFDKHAFDKDTLLWQLEESQDRIRNNPAAQRIREEARIETNREMLPVLVSVTFSNTLIWFLPAWFLPGLFPPLFCAIGFVATTVFVLGVFYKRPE